MLPVLHTRKVLTARPYSQELVEFKFKFTSACPSM